MCEGLFLLADQTSYGTPGTTETSRPQRGRVSESRDGWKTRPVGLTPMAGVCGWRRRWVTNSFVGCWNGGHFRFAAFHPTIRHAAPTKDEAGDQPSSRFALLIQGGAMVEGALSLQCLHESSAQRDGVKGWHTTCYSRTI
jgi:hypothetical protein